MDNATYKVGEWTVTPSRCLLERSGRSIKIKPRTMQLLVYLVSRGGRVVSMDELIRSVWQGRVVSDGAIYYNVNRLRQALGDDRDDVKYIQTIPKQGYRLVAAVTTFDPETKSKPSEVLGIPPRLVGSAVLGLVVFLVGLFLFTSPFEDRSRVAVLPFSNEGAAEPETVEFVNGIHNETLIQLGKISSLTVIGRNSVMEYRDSPKNVREIGRELGVDALLQGQVQRAADMVRINVQLIDAENAEQLWGESYSRELTAESIFAIQSEIATAIADELNAAITPEEVARLSEIPTRNERAWLLYQSGIHYLRSNNEVHDLPIAVEQFKAATDEDRQFAQAWLALGQAHSYMFNLGHDPTEGRQRSAFAALQRAQSLAPQSPEVHLALSNYYARTGDKERALQELEIASRGMPNSAELYQRRAFDFRRMGRWTESIEAFIKWLDLDPRSSEVRSDLARTYYLLRDYARAEEYLGEELLIWPDHEDAYPDKAQLSLWRDGNPTSTSAVAADPQVALGAVRERMGWIAALYDRDWDLALQYATDMEELYIGDRRYIPRDSYIGVTYQLAEQGERARHHFLIARDQLEEALAANEEDARLYVTLGEALVGLGEPAEAVRLARRAIDILPRSEDAIAGPRIQIDAIVRVLAPAGEVHAVIEALDDYLMHPGEWSIEGLLPDPRFDSVREDPRLQELVEKYRRPAER